MNWTIFKPPYETNARAGSKTRIWPVFLPFKGCVNRCIYCSQHVLTGVGASDLNSIFNTLVTDLEQALAANVTPLEMAFFGSTFTNLPKMWIFKFLDLAQEYRKKGLITRIRCSTRPDSFDLSLLTELRAQGMDLVELGIQSFTDEILTAAKRGYTGREAEEACRMVRESGLTLGIQLMPGLIGDRPGYFQCDVRRAMAQAPECVRLYPCLALKGTKLAKIWHEGGFRPWSLARAVDELTRAYMAFRHGGISVIRMGLAQEPGLEKIIAAGPNHPSLGNMVKSRALFAHVWYKVMGLGKKPGEIFVPKRLQGEFFGFKAELAKDYAKIGLARNQVLFWDKDYFLLTSANGSTKLNDSTDK